MSSCCWDRPGSTSKGGYLQQPSLGVFPGWSLKSRYARFPGAFPRVGISSVIAVWFQRFLWVDDMDEDFLCLGGDGISLTPELMLEVDERMIRIFITTILLRRPQEGVVQVPSIFLVCVFLLKHWMLCKDWNHCNWCSPSQLRAFHALPVQNSEDTHCSSPRFECNLSQTNFFTLFFVLPSQCLRTLLYNDGTLPLIHIYIYMYVYIHSIPP